MGEKKKKKKLKATICHNSQCQTNADWNKAAFLKVWPQSTLDTDLARHEKVVVWSERKRRRYFWKLMGNKVYFCAPLGSYWFRKVAGGKKTSVRLMAVWSFLLSRRSCTQILNMELITAFQNAAAEVCRCHSSPLFPNTLRPSLPTLLFLSYAPINLRHFFFPPNMIRRHWLPYHSATPCCMDFWKTAFGYNVTQRCTGKMECKKVQPPIQGPIFLLFFWWHKS